MKKYSIALVLLSACLLVGCAADKKLYTNLDGTGSLWLSHYTALLPTLGSCGFSRDEDAYHIELPRRVEKLIAASLKFIPLAMIQVFIILAILNF